MELRPKDGFAHEGEANAELQLGDYAGVIRESTLAIELSPEEGLSYYNRGLAKECAGDLAGALVDYETAVVRGKAGDEYAGLARIHQYLTAVRLGEGSQTSVESARRGQTGWAAAVASYITGGMSAEGLLAEAGKTEASVTGVVAEKLAGQRGGAAEYFIGERLWLNGDLAGARAAWEKCVAAGLENVDETELAKAELGRAGK